MSSVTWLRSAAYAAVTAILMAPGVGSSEANSGTRYDPETRAYNLAHGRVVFTENCLKCHEQGRDGAPILGEVDDWRERLEQPLSVLIQHAIEGHGDMPARGDLDLSDQSVAAAVAYVVDRARLIATTDDINDLPPPAAGPSSQPRATAVTEASDDAIVQMLFMLIGKDRWK